METTNQLKKYVKSLHANKHRQKYDKFIAEGPKICAEFLKANKYSVEYLFCTPEWYDTNAILVEKVELSKVHVIKEKVLAQISNLKTANKVLLVMDQIHSVFTDKPHEIWSLYLDKIQDPGNMGTILRIADWYGIETIKASSDSVHYYNPKVIQSAMGAHNRLQLVNLTNEVFLADDNSYKYGLALEGVELTKTLALDPGTIIIGNESKGINSHILASCKEKITIPRLGGAESLNASVACGIACQLLIGS